MDLPEALPAVVAAARLKVFLADVLMEPVKRQEIPETLRELERDLGMPDYVEMVTDSKTEVSAWFAALYMVKTARGLREVQPDTGDVVAGRGWVPEERRVVSSIDDHGRVFMKGSPLRMAWPNNLKVIARVGDENHREGVHCIESRLRNGRPYKRVDYGRLERLKEYALRSQVPSPEAVRALEEMLDSGEKSEESLQKLLSKNPTLLAPHVVGSWGAYVIPKPKLGAEYVPDFLLLGVNSNGLDWLMVEIEGARHPIVIRDGSLSKQTRHAVKQVQDWREWLTDNVKYAQDELGYYGLTNRAPGLVVIGRSDPTTERQRSRSQSGDAGIKIHSWDWLLRSALNRLDDPLWQSVVARQREIRMGE